MTDLIGCMSANGDVVELTERFCDPCFKGGKSRSVAGYCPKCVEFYCQSCLAAHCRMAVSERHKILQGSDMPASQTDKPVKYQLCVEHDGEDKDRYCIYHGITICGICCIRKHKQCHVKEVSESCKTFNMSAEKESFRAGVGLLLKRVKQTRKSIKSNKARLEKKKQNVLKKAKKQRDKLLEKINQSYKDFCGEVTSLFNDHTTTLSAHQSALDELATEIDTILQSLKKSGPTKQTDAKEFLELYFSAKKVRLLEDKTELFNLKHIDIKCILNTNIQPLIITKSKFGEISLQTIPFQYRTERPSIHYPYIGPRQDPYKVVRGQGVMRANAAPSIKLVRLKKMKVEIQKDKYDCLISGVDITHDENSLLMDIDNGKVKLFSPDGKLLSFLKPPDNPVDVSVINKSKAAISMSTRQIGIIDIAESSRITLKRIIRTEQKVWRITAYNNNLILICGESPERRRLVQMIDMRGKVQWTTTVDSEGNRLFDSAMSLTTCSGDHGDTVVITDRKKQTITVLDAGTGNVVKVCDVKEKKPLGVTVDDYGNVYVCYESGEINVWSTGMQEETRLKDKRKYLPRALAFNRTRSELVITSRAEDTKYCDFVHRYKVVRR